MNRNSKRTITSTLGRVGSGNVFVDLRLPNAEEELLKAKLVSKIAGVIEKRNLTQIQAGQIMGLAQSKVSELCNGRTETYSVERLYRLLTRLGVGVSVVLEEQPDWSLGRIEVIEAPSPESHHELGPGLGM
ncbi:helix-turn-helix domain-containing protein [Bradyrhizobium sp. USDA 4502]